MPRHYYIKTYGCQMNEHDSLKIGGILAQRGFAPTDSQENADLILFNTCTIREKAEQKAMSEVGKLVELKRERPSLLIGVCGCVAQQEQRAIFSRFRHVDLLFGPDQIHVLPELLDRVERDRKQVAALDLVNDPASYEFVDLIPDGTTWTAGPTAFVTIMKGCDSNCAFCIVPRVRGLEVCRPADDIVDEIQKLTAQGVKEVTLLGQTVNTYGSRRHPGVIPFADLLQRIADETPLERLRFTSPHPKDLNDALINAYRTNPILCHHMHLPLQAGSDATLRAMRRSYSREQYLRKVDELRAACADVAITTDLIVGFPGETETDFLATLDLVERIRFDGVFAFKYSPRPGTHSFTQMHDDVLSEAKDDRLQRLLALGNKIIAENLRARVGATVEVLVEGESRRAPFWKGRTTHNTLVHFVSDHAKPGDLLGVRITRANGHSLEGEVVARQD